MKFDFDVKIPEVIHKNETTIKNVELHISFECQADEIRAYGEIVKMAMKILGNSTP